MADPRVKPLKKVEELKNKLEENQNKVVVLEFMKPDNQVYNYMKRDVEQIADEKKDKAVFYELNVNTFMKYAEKFQVEALPAFVLMKRFIKKRHVLDKDELKKAIDQVYEQIQGEGKSGSGHDGSAGGPNNNNAPPVKKQEVQQANDPSVQEGRSWCVLM